MNHLFDKNCECYAIYVSQTSTNVLSNMALLKIVIILLMFLCKISNVMPFLDYSKGKIAGNVSVIHLLFLFY